MIGGSQEFKDAYEFGMADSYILITKINLEGEFIWNSEIEKVRTKSSAKLTFIQSFINNGEYAHILYNDTNEDNYVSVLKLTTVDIIDGNLTTNPVAYGKKPGILANYSTNSFADLSYFSSENSKIYFVNYKSGKYVISSIILDF